MSQPDAKGSTMTVAIAKLVAASALVTGLWEQVDPLVGGAVAFVTIAAAAYKSVLLPVIRTVRKAGDVYDSLTTMDERVGKQIVALSGQVTSLDGKVDRLAANARGREDEIEGNVGKLDDRVEKLEVMVEAIRFILGTRSGDHPPEQRTGP